MKSNKRKNTNSVLEQKYESVRKTDAETTQTSLPLDDERVEATKKVAEEVAEEAAETVAEEAAEEVAEEATEEVAEEATEEVAEEAAEDVVEEAEDDEDDDEDAEEVEETAEEVVEAKANKGKSSDWFWKLCGVMGLIALVISIALCAKMFVGAPEQTTQTTSTTQTTVSTDSTQSTVGTQSTTQTTQSTVSSVTTQSSATTQTTQTTQTTATTVPTPVIFDMDAFKEGVAGIATGIKGEEANEAFVNVIVDNIGENQLKAWIVSYGEITVKQEVANFIAFAAEIEMQRYIANEGLLYNPNSKIDYLVALEAADKAYSDATGKNPNGVVMSLPNYDDYKSSRAAMEKLIADSGDTELLKWYKDTNTLFDLRKQQERDTEKALAYKVTVEQKLVQSKGITDVINLQLKKVADGSLTVMDYITYKYTDAYSQFVLQNWMYILAK